MHDGRAPSPWLHAGVPVTPVLVSGPAWSLQGHGVCPPVCPPVDPTEVSSSGQFKSSLAYLGRFYGFLMADGDCPFKSLNGVKCSLTGPRDRTLKVYVPDISVLELEQAQRGGSPGCGSDGDGPQGPFVSCLIFIYCSRSQHKERGQ